jgi:uncharacterized membrane protein YgcG
VGLQNLVDNETETLAAVGRGNEGAVLDANDFQIVHDQLPLRL